MEDLPPETLSVVPHVTFLIFNLTIPNIIAWIVIVASVFLASWARLPKIF